MSTAPFIEGNSGPQLAGVLPVPPVQESQGLEIPVHPEQCKSSDCEQALVLIKGTRLCKLPPKIFIQVSAVMIDVQLIVNSHCVFPLYCRGWREFL